MSSLQMPEPAPPQAPQPLPGPLDQPDPAGQQDPLQVLQDCIQSLPAVIAALPDPQDTQDAVKALGILAGIQTRLMRGAGGPQTGG